MKKQAIYLLLFVIGYGGLFVGSNKGIRRKVAMDRYFSPSQSKKEEL